MAREPLARTYRDRSLAVQVEGLKALRRALSKTESNANPYLKSELRELGTHVRDKARAYAPVGPRPRRSRSKPLRGSIKVSSTLQGVSVYSDADHAIVQDRGGWVGRRTILGKSGLHGSTLLQRNKVSRYMTRAVEDTQPEVERRVQKVLDRLGSDFER